MFYTLNPFDNCFASSSLTLLLDSIQTEKKLSHY